MHWIRFTSIVALLLCSSIYSFSQRVETHTTYGDLGNRCEGDTIKIGYWDEISCFKYKYGTCSSPFSDEYKDQSGQIQTSSIGFVSIDEAEGRSYLAGSNRELIKVMIVTYVAKETTKIKIVSDNFIEPVVGETCPNDPPTSHIFRRIWIYDIQVTPKPPQPKLTAERFISSGKIIYLPSGCPIDQPGYSYQVNSTWCEEQATNNFSTIELNFGRFEGVAGVNYRIRCNANYGQCASKPSEFVIGMNYNPPDNDCVPESIKPQIDNIENLKQVNSFGEIEPTYHKFFVKSKICDQFENGCTVDNVYNRMISENQFITPIPSDLPGIDLFGIDKRYATKNQPVKSCSIVNLPALLGEAVVKLVQKPPQCSLSNPVMTYTDAQNHIAINYTLQDHIFSPGRVLRKIIELCDGIYVLTIGEGLSNIGIGVAEINQNFGDNIFKKVDKRLKKSIVGR